MPEPPRVALDLTSTQRARLTGWERFATTYAERLQAAPHLASPLELTWERAASGRWGMLARQLGWYGSGLARAVGGTDVEVLHALAFPPGRTARPTVWTVHDSLVLGGHPEYARRGGRIWVPLGRRALAWVDVVVTDTRSVAAELVDLGLAASGVRVATPGVPTLPPPTHPPTLRRASDGHVAPIPGEYLLVVGTLEPRKQPAIALEAGRMLGVPVVFVGGVDPTFDTSILTGYAHAYRTSHLSDGELSWLYRHARASVHPSAYEGLDLPLLEALSHGVPAVASDIPVHRELAEGAAALVPADDPSAFARALEAIEPARGWQPPRWDDCLAAYASVYRQLSERDW